MISKSTSIYIYIYIYEQILVLYKIQIKTAFLIWCHNKPEEGSQLYLFSSCRSHYTTTEGAPRKAQWCYSERLKFLLPHQGASQLPSKRNKETFWYSVRKQIYQPLWPIFPHSVQQLYTPAPGRVCVRRPRHSAQHYNPVCLSHLDLRHSSEGIPHIWERQ